MWRVFDSHMPDHFIKFGPNMSDHDRRSRAGKGTGSNCDNLKILTGTV